MANLADLVKLCQFSTPVVICDSTNPAAPVSRFAVMVTDAGGGLIPFGSTQYPVTPATAAANGLPANHPFVTVGAIASYVCDASGAPLAVQPATAAISVGACAGASAPDVEFGVLWDQTTPGADPVPVRVETVGGVSTFFSIATGLPVVPTVSQQFAGDNTRYSYTVGSPICLFDPAGAKLGSFTPVYAWDTDNLLAPPTPISTSYIDDLGAVVAVLPPGTIGSCDANINRWTQYVCVVDSTVLPATRATYVVSHAINPVTGVIISADPVFNLASGDFAVAVPPAESATVRYIWGQSCQPGFACPTCNEV